ncbi:hypothetical protein [Nonomuraea aurantiaca]|uniref:hypothetical protein n=1 Tax=Nonomuraea aurantiaca TaxID=2878562 RepID=UPI001CD9581D|nr:hypothetical protein [Nonomuraea aurantiaca]MCA2228830.1 hypothetical protein [Nonomuraea aurantiaca]
MLTLALAWTSVEIQGVAADEFAPWTREWVTGWLIGPAVSLLVLAVFGTRIYLITRGQPIRSPKLIRIERLFLAAMLVLCGWPHLPWVADTFSLWGLALHVPAPVVAIAVVAGLPVILTNGWTDDGLNERGGAA